MDSSLNASEDGMEQRFKVSLCVVSGILSSALAFISALANTILLIVIYKDPLKCFRKPIGVFIAALALVDLITGAAVSIHHLKEEISCALGQQTSRPKYGHFASIVSFFTLNAGNYILFALSIERLLAVAYPFYYRRSASLKKTVVCVASIFCYSLLFCLLQLTSLPETVYVTVQLHLNISFPLAVVITVNVLTWHILKRHRMRANSMTSEASDTFSAKEHSGSRGYEREREFAFTAIVIAVFFAVSLIPFYVIIQIEEHCTGCTSAWWFIVCKKLSLPLLFVSSAANPFIYTLRLSQCRRSCRMILCCTVTRDKHSNVELKGRVTVRSDAENTSVGQADSTAQTTWGECNDGVICDTKL